MADEVSTDLQAIGGPVRGGFENFAKETGREIKLEIEPGTFLVANAGSLVSTVQVTSMHVLSKVTKTRPPNPLDNVAFNMYSRNVIVY